MISVPIEPGGNAPRGGVCELLAALARSRSEMFCAFREILAEIMGGPGLDRLPVLHHGLDGQGHVCTGETLVLGFLTGDDGDGEVVAEELLVEAVDHPGFDQIASCLGSRAPCGLPARGTPPCAGTCRGTHLPAHHVRPLVDEQGKIAVGLHPAREGRTDDGLGGRADHVGLRQARRSGASWFSLSPRPSRPQG